MTTNASSSTIKTWLISAESTLSKAGITTSRLDALVLLSDILKKDKSYLLAHSEENIPIRNLNLLNKQILRRAKHEPLAYIRGKSEFYGYSFLVNNYTLEPRSETETMIELFTQIYKSQKPPLQKVRPFTERENMIWDVVDVGTGSGAIGISVKLEHPELDVSASDISTECINIAKQNSMIHDTNISYFLGNLLEPFLVNALHHPNVILANLPYVPDSSTINQAAMHEPRIAIFGGEDGLDLYRALFTQISNSNNPAKKFHKPRFVFTESQPSQHKALEKIALDAGYKLATSEDFIQVFDLI